MFLVSDERLRVYAPPVQILMLIVAVIGCCVILYLTFWEEFYKIVFTDETRVPSDYPGFILAVTCLITIAITLYRLGNVVHREVTATTSPRY
jgi:amino acid permease